MFLSRLLLNPKSKQVRSELANPYEMHRTVMHAFEGVTELAERVLFRAEEQEETGIPVLLVQSISKPDWAFLSSPNRNYLHPLNTGLSLVDENPSVKCFDLLIHAGQHLVFRLRANPTVKKTINDGEGQRKTRLGIVHEEDQLVWLERKLESAGAILISTRTSNQKMVEGALNRGNKHHKLTYLSVQFDGLLQVNDTDKFYESFRNGIGSGKGLGFGMLSLAKPNQALN